MRCAAAEALRLVKQHAKKDKELELLLHQYQATQQQLQDCSERLASYEAGQFCDSQRLAQFGQHAALRALVERNREKFTKEPIGPLGMYLAVTEVRWAVAAEAVLGDFMEHWIVNCSEDEKELRRLASTITPTGLLSSNAPPGYLQVVVNKYKVPVHRAASPNSPANRWRMLRSVIMISSSQAHIIDGELMDLTRYHLTVLDDDESRCEAAVHTEYTPGAGVVVTSAVHISGTRYSRFWSPRLRYNPNKGTPRLTSLDQDSIIRGMKHEKQRMSELKVESQACLIQLVTLIKELKSLQSSMSVLQSGSRPPADERVSKAARTGSQPQPHAAAGAMGSRGCAAAGSGLPPQTQQSAPTAATLAAAAAAAAAASAAAAAAAPGIAADAGSCAAVCAVFDMAHDLLEAARQGADGSMLQSYYTALRRVRAAAARLAVVGHEGQTPAALQQQQQRWMAVFGRQIKIFHAHLHHAGACDDLWRTAVLQLLNDI